MNERETLGLVNPLVAAAHEVKTPLTVIAHIAAHAEQDFAAMTPAQQQLALRRIRLSAERTLRLVQGLTIGEQLTRHEQLGLGFDLESLNILQVCEEVVEETLPFAHAYNQQVCLQTAARPHLVVGNRELVRSVLFNLIDNAIKHNPPETAVRMGISRRQSVVRIQVQDTGPGLRRRDFQRLTDTLGHELQPLHGRPGNSGLGLYIAGQLARAMGGSLGVGRAQQGANFYVDLLHSQQLSLW
jgi:two-component system sensor histidine kinase QseC